MHGTHTHWSLELFRNEEKKLKKKNQANALNFENQLWTPEKKLIWDNTHAQRIICVNKVVPRWAYEMPYFDHNLRSGLSEATQKCRFLYSLEEWVCRCQTIGHHEVCSNFGDFRTNRAWVVNAQIKPSCRWRMSWVAVDTSKGTSSASLPHPDRLMRHFVSGALWVTHGTKSTDKWRAIEYRQSPHDRRTVSSEYACGDKRYWSSMNFFRAKAKWIDVFALFAPIPIPI